MTTVSQSLRLDGVLVTQYGAELTIEVMPDTSVVARRNDDLVVFIKADGTKVVTEPDGLQITVQYVCSIVQYCLYVTLGCAHLHSPDGHMIAKHLDGVIVETQFETFRPLCCVTPESVCACITVLTGHSRHTWWTARYPSDPR